MKIIMFSDKFGLTEAVLSGRKTQTRRIITCPKEFKGEWVAGFYVYKRQSDNAIIQWPCMYDADECTFDGGEILPKYKVGEIVAVAQSYKDMKYSPAALDRNPKDYTNIRGTLGDSKGWCNKMFVRTAACKHHIRITNVRVERLQDISDEECIKEGVIESVVMGTNGSLSEYFVEGPKHICYGKTPREAYAVLIDLISGKGTWSSNPYVFVYDFELVD